MVKIYHSIRLFPVNHAYQFPHSSSKPIITHYIIWVVGVFDVCLFGEAFTTYINYAIRTFNAKCVMFRYDEFHMIADQTEMKFVCHKVSVVGYTG